MPKPATSPAVRSSEKRAHVIVIGGGIAGLLSAHMLKDRFSEVTVLERSRYVEAFDDTPKTRPEVPQSHCLHMLMGAGTLAFDELVPGWREALVAQGAPSYDAGADLAMRVATGWLQRVKTGITLYGASRCLIEATLLSLLRDAGNVRIMTGQRVVGLEISQEGSDIRGVHLGSTRGARVLNRVDMVVDASGSASRLSRWLGQHFGDQKSIAVTEVAPGRQYVSSWVHLAPTQSPEWQGLSIAPTLESGGCAGMMMRAERNLWGVVLQAPDGVPLPTDHNAFLELSAELPDSTLYSVLKRASPAAPVHLFGRTANRCRHYEDYPHWPNNLFAVGDSVCALDPYAGLGMTAAARGVQLLSRYLDGAEAAEPKPFQAQLARHNRWPWMIATRRGTDVSSSLDFRGQIDSLAQAAPFDPSLSRLLLEIQHMIRAPETLSKEAVA